MNDHGSETDPSETDGALGLDNPLSKTLHVFCHVSGIDEEGAVSDDPAIVDGAVVRDHDYRIHPPQQCFGQR